MRAAESTATSATPGEKPWIQKLYRKYRNSTKCKTTQFEIAEKGVLGLYGQVDFLPGPESVAESIKRRRRPLSVEGPGFDPGSGPIRKEL